MNRFFTLIAIILLVTAISSAKAQYIPKFKARIEVSVTADENIRGMVASYINRELRSLHDIELVDHDPEWVLQILVAEPSTKGGYKAGIVLSVIILPKFSNQFLASVLPDSYKEVVSKMTSNLYHYPDHWLLTGSIEDLKELCNSVVADFDTKYIEESRKKYRKMNRLLMEMLQKTNNTEGNKP